MATKINFKKVKERLTSAGIMAAGSVASNYASGIINKSLGARATPKINAGIRLAVGAMLPSFLGESKKAGMITDFSNGMLAEAAVSLAKAFNVPGVSGTDIENSINGYSILNGTEIENSISGTTL